MKTSTKLLIVALMVTSLSAIKAFVSEQAAFAEVRKQEQADNSFQPGWLIQRIKSGDLEGFKKEIVWDSFAIGGVEGSRKPESDTLLKIAADAKYSAPTKEDQDKYAEIIFLLLKNKADKSQWGSDVDWKSDSEAIKEAKLGNSSFGYLVLKGKKIIVMPKKENIK